MFEPKVYLKDESFDPIYRPVNKKFLLRSKIYPSILISVGLFILATQVLVPLVYFKTADEVSRPISSTVLGVASGFRDFEFAELPADKKVLGSDTTIPEYFYMTVPKLKIEKALVETNAKTLDPSLALGHYKGSALPGKVGNTFIYGHSVLPWFFNPKNYKTIFSTLDKLSTGDLIHIWYKTEKLTYVVETKELLHPDAVKPLAEVKPDFLNESTVTLMTCAPPGTKLKRLLVYGVLRR